MKTSRFSEQQIAFILKQAEDGTTVEEVCRKAGISVQTYYRWRSKYGGLKLLIVDELGYVPLSPTGAELLFEILSQRYERGSTIITSNLPFEDWTQVLASERLTGALLDRLTHHVSILTMNGDSYRLKQSTGRRRAAGRAEQNQASAISDPDTGEIPPP